MDYRQQIFHLAMSIINIPLDQVDNKIRQSLEQTAEHFKADRAGIFDYDFSAGTLSNIYEWCAPGISAGTDNLQTLPLTQLSDWIPVHARGELIHIPDVSVLPDQPLRKILLSQQIKSWIVLPMMSEATCLGFVCFAAVQQQRHVGSEEIELLRLYAGLLVNLRERIDNEKKLYAKELHQKILQASLALQHKKNRLLFEMALEAVYLHDLDGQIQDVNQAACKQTGRSREELLEMSVFDLDVGSSSRNEILLAWKSMNEGDGWELESKHRHIKGHDFSVELRINKISENDRFLMLTHVRDISRRKNAEEELTKKEQFYRNALDSIPGIVYVSQPNGDIEYVNLFAKYFTCASIKELSGLGWLKLIHHEDRERLATAWQEAITNIKQYSEEFRLRRYDGQYEWFHSKALPIKDESGRIEQFFGVALSIESLKQATDTIAKREALLATITENINETILMLDRDHRLVYINRAGIDTIGTSLGQSDLEFDDLVGKWAKDFFPDPDVAEMLISADEHAMRTGLPSSDEHTLMTAEGLRTLLINRLPLRDSVDQVSGLVLIAHDITETKKQERQRYNSVKRQRDTLVREVHHRIKNHLQGILGLVRNATVNQPELAAFIEPTIRQIKSIADVYGMNSTNSSTAITVSELIGRIISSYPEQDKIEFSPESDTQTLILQSDEAVPTALIINELLNNAVKHRLTSSPPRPVKITLSRMQELTCLAIAAGPAYLPAGFDIDQWSSLGTGLELVQALMPSQDCRLEFEQLGDEVVVTYCFLADSQPPIPVSS